MPNGDGSSFDFGSFFDALLGQLGAIIDAIIQFLQSLVQAIVSALNFLLSGIQDTFGFSFASLGEIYQGLSKLMDRIFKQVILASLLKLYDLYKKLVAWATKLKAWLDRLHALMQKYQMMYFRKIIQIIQRARKILTIFRFFHLKFAQKLDNWLATIEGKLAHYLILVGMKTNEIISWVNLIVDPRGALKTFPFLAGFISALDVTWSGIFGTAFNWFPGFGASGNPTSKIKQTITKTGEDTKTGAGEAGTVTATWSVYQQRFSDEMGGG